jgi:glycosyltransferase involved in cell wall biosynthesis
MVTDPALLGGGSSRDDVWVSSGLRALARRTSLPQLVRRTRVRTLRTLPRRPSPGARERLATGRLRIVAHTPSYPPVVNAGSEQTLHELSKELQRRGHTVDVLVDGDGYPGDWQGVPITRASNRRAVSDLYLASDVVLTQLGSRNRAMRLAARYGRPTVQLLHMGGVDVHRGSDRPDLLVFGSEWLRERDRPTGRSLVLHPRVDPDRVATSPGTANTLIGLSERKGSATLYALAERCPEREFLGVLGSWGDQVLPATESPNLRIVENASDVRTVYAQTRVLLIPSSHEQFGPRVAIEAGVSGIPTIAHPGPGIEEALGDTGMYAARDDIEAWVRHLEALDVPSAYQRESERAQRNSLRWTFDRELDAFESQLLELVRDE